MNLLLNTRDFFIIPERNRPQDIAFDYGDTSSGGEVLDGAYPMADTVEKFEESLLDSLQTLVKTKFN